LVPPAASSGPLWAGGLDEALETRGGFAIVSAPFASFSHPFAQSQRHVRRRRRSQSAVPGPARGPHPDPSLPQGVAEGETLTFDKVCLVGGEGQGRIGTPFVNGASVVAKVVRQVKGPKVITGKFRRRKNSRRRRGFRAQFTVVQIESIQRVSRGCRTAVPPSTGHHA
jgi:ribosomal protein L21